MAFRFWQRGFCLFPLAKRSQGFLCLQRSQEASAFVERGQNVQFAKHVFSSIKTTLVKTSIFLKGRQQKYHFHSLILCLCSGFAEATSAPTIKLDGKGDQEKYNISQLTDLFYCSSQPSMVHWLSSPIFPFLFVVPLW